MATIDSLEIQIESNLKSLNGSLTRLSKKIGELGANLSALDGARLTNFATGVTNLAVAVNQIGSIDSRKFKTLASNLSQLTNVNYSGLIASASAVHTFISTIGQLNVGNLESITTGVGQFASAINRFGREGAANAVQNIPLITNAFMQMMTELQHAPAVSQNVIDLANSMAALLNAARGSNGPVRNASTAVRIFGTSAGYSAKKARSLASSIGLLYARLWVFVRLGQKAWSAVKKGMDYIEIVNYMNAAFEQVAQKADLSAFKDLGYESAQAYADSFYSTASKLTETMSGFSASGSGLSSTGGTTLGVNAAQMMRYQAQFAQLASSMGVSSEYAVKLSTALTEIGADLASVKNMDFNDVWDNLSSGLVGMSRSIDKYGANIRATNLQETLATLGITENIQNLNQSDKALLRTIVILNSTKYAWADLADTLGQPANQLRMLKSNVQALATTLGQIFLPIVAKVIPYLNMLVVALQRLFEYLRGLIGVEWISTGSGSVSDLMSDVLDDAEDIASATDDAAGSAKEFKKQLLGIDELNVLSEKDDSGSGASAGVGNITGLLEAALDNVLGEYQKVWDDAYSKVEQSYQKFADNVKKAFEEGGFKGVGKYFSDLIVNALTNIPWDKVREFCRTFASNVADFLNGFITPELFAEVGKSLVQSFNSVVELAFGFGSKMEWEDLGASIGSGANAIIEGLDTQLLADTIDVWVQGIWTAIKAAFKVLDWSEAFATISDTVLNLDIDTVYGIVCLLTITSVTKWVISGGVAKAAKAALVGLLFPGGKFSIKNLMVGIESLGFLTLGTPQGDTFFAWLEDNVVGPALTKFFDWLPDKFSEGLEKSLVLAITTAVGTMAGGPIGSAIGALVGAIALAIGDGFTAKDFLNAVIDGFKKFIHGVFNWDMSMELFDASRYFFGDIVDAFKKWDWGRIGKDIVLGIISGLTGLLSTLTEPIWDLFTTIYNDICSVFGIHSPAETMKPLGGYIVQGIIEGFKAGMSGILSVISTLKNTIIAAWDNLKTATSQKWTAICNSIGSAINSIKSFLNFNWKWPAIKTPHISWTEGGATATGVVKAILEALSLPTSLPKMKVDWYAQGGFPDTGSLFVANEAGPELVGTIGGQTAVANQSQIVEAVAQGVASAVSAVLGNGNRGGQTIQMVVDGKVLYQTVVNENNRQIQRTGASALRA